MRPMMQNIFLLAIIVCSALASDHPLGRVASHRHHHTPEVNHARQYHHQLFEPPLEAMGSHGAHGHHEQHHQRPTADQLGRPSISAALQPTIIYAQQTPATTSGAISTSASATSPEPRSLLGHQSTYDHWGSQSTSLSPEMQLTSKHQQESSTSSNDNMMDILRQLEKPTSTNQTFATAVAAAAATTTTTTAIMTSTVPTIDTYNNDMRFVPEAEAETEPPIDGDNRSVEQRNPTSSSAISNYTTIEGPVTVPPLLDYGRYNMGDAQLQFGNSNENNLMAPFASAASMTWWLSGIGAPFSVASKLTRDNYRHFCQTSKLLVSNKQRSLCASHPKMMPIIARGIRMAIEECQYQFAESRWNCSLSIDPNTDPLIGDQLGNQLGNNQIGHAIRVRNSAAIIDNAIPYVFGAHMAQPNREHSFLNAIGAAGIAYAITKACSRAELGDECGCNTRMRKTRTHARHASGNQDTGNNVNIGQQLQQQQQQQQQQQTSMGGAKWDWGGCSDDILYGTQFSREFTDSSENQLAPASMISVHNYEVGRRVLKSSIDLMCKCAHGQPDASCATKMCWKTLASFRTIGDELMARYERATQVQLAAKRNLERNSRSKLRPVKRGVRKPKSKDLVFVNESPDYCVENRRLGVFGTRNRHCNSTSQGLDSCSLLCCGRGYQTETHEVEQDCECKFVYCCEVKCKKCKRTIEIDVCN